MTQEQKDLLLRDLCARLPYKVKVQDTYYKSLEPAPIWLLDLNAQSVRLFADEGYQSIEYIKPYLFPLSSISEDQKYDFYCRFIKNDCNFDDFKKFLYDGMWRRKLLTFTSLYDIEAIIDWFHKNHIDYRDLIPMGLALDATGKNIY